MPDPVNPNPNPNQDSTTSQTTENPNSWASPKDGDGDGFVKFYEDDIHPERKIRLGQFLSDHSSGTLTGPDNDNSNGNSSHFPIENPEPTEYSPFINTGHSYTSLVETVAEEYFQDLGKQNSFIPGVGDHEGGALEGPIRFQDGHNVLRNASDIVEAHITDSLSNTSSRWSGIGVERFNPTATEDELYQVQRAGPHLDSTPLDQTMGSRFRSFEFVSGSVGGDTLSSGFWDEYFGLMQQVGPRITLAASGHRDPTDAKNGKNRGSVTGGAGLEGGPEGIEKVLGDYKKVDVQGTEAGNAFDENEEFSTMSISTSPTSSGESWGQLYSWASPYSANNATDGLTVAEQLVEIWLMVQLRILTVTAIFQAASMVLSTITSPQGPGIPPGQDILAIPWNRNYYPPNVQIQPGTAFRKGQSGFNHSPVNIVEKGLESINRLSADTFNNYFANLVPQLLGGAVNQLGISVEEEILNFTSKVLREVNVYIPRHTLSTSANVSGYNKPGDFPLFLLKTLDVATAYTRASAAGMGALAVHVVAGHLFENYGYWRNIFRQVVRSKAYLKQLEIDHPEQIHTVYEGILKFVGKDDKIMRFVNYLVMLGDMSIGRGFAGKLAFPENKVELKEVADFPTLRTSSTRKKAGFFSTNKSRLSLTETPSLYLMPKSLYNIQLGLEDAGLAKPTNPWGKKLSGENALKNNVIDDNDKELNSGVIDPINQRFQARQTNRFSADQVRRIEDQLEAEHMPFYIQDLRTNEIISFHAFLTSLSDAYTGEWSAQKGFGRLEAAQIYGGGSRAIGVSFMMVPMNEQDFDEMYVKINKLTTLVYPQWSEGTTITTGEGTFVQPFSQVPTASPLCRIRVGDIFTSNYSKANMARMMGIGKPTFVYGTEPRRNNDIPIPNENTEQIRYVGRAVYQMYVNTHYTDPELNQQMMDAYDADPIQFEAVYDEFNGTLFVKLPTVPLPKLEMITSNIDRSMFLNLTEPVPTTAESGEVPPAATQEGDVSIASLFSNDNPIFKSFESTMGRGIAVAITGITFDWKLNSVPWELKAGSRAPRMCEVQLSITPIHDITPGIDHEGFNRAPIYRVGETSQSVSGDVWYDAAKYDELTSGIERQHQAALLGKEIEE